MHVLTCSHAFLLQYTVQLNINKLGEGGEGGSTKHLMAR